jgi:hypothetical protein
VSAELFAVWDELERSELPPGITARRFNRHAAVDLFVGVELPGRGRLVFLEAGEPAIAAWKADWPQSTGFSVNVEGVSSSHNRLRVVVRLVGAAYRDVFGALVADVLAAVAAAASERDGVIALAARLERWQKFLAKHGPEGLSPLQQRGLYGELWFLTEQVVPEAGPAGAVASWTGPLAKDQDFQFRACSVEVKVTAANPDQKIHVSNVRQLDDTGRGTAPLFLLHVALEERKAQGDTLVELVRRARDLVAGGSHDFEERLRLAGYLDVHASRYEGTGYVVKSSDFFRVGDGFPRILERELRPGVGNVEYTISVGACAPFKVTAGGVLSLLGETA